MGEDDGLRVVLNGEPPEARDTARADGRVQVWRIGWRVSDAGHGMRALRAELAALLG